MYYLGSVPTWVKSSEEFWVSSEDAGTCMLVDKDIASLLDTFLDLKPYYSVLKGQVRKKLTGGSEYYYAGRNMFKGSVTHVRVEDGFPCNGMWVWRVMFALVEDKEWHNGYLFLESFTLNLIDSFCLSVPGAISKRKANWALSLSGQIDMNVR